MASRKKTQPPGRSATSWITDAVLLTALATAGLIIYGCSAGARPAVRQGARPAVRQGASPATQPAAQGQILWGETVAGRQAGIQLVGPQRPYALGEKVGLAFHVRNRSARPFVTRAMDDAKGWMAHLVEPEGDISLKQFLRGEARPRAITIRPGDAACVGNIAFELTLGAPFGTGPFLHVWTGINAIRFDLDISHLTRPKYYYTGLPSGILKLAITEAQPATQPAVRQGSP